MKKFLEKDINMFLAITFGVVWVAMLISFIAGVRYGDETFTWVLNFAMLVPAIALIIIRRRRNEAINLEGMYAHPHFALRTITTYLISYLLPAVCMILGAAAFFALNPSIYQADAADYINALISGGLTPEDAQARFNGVLAMSVLVGPLLSAFFALFEEIGFRGFLLHEVEASIKGKNSALKASAITSACWAVWYIPMFALGFRYGGDYAGAPLFGILVGVVVFFLIGMMASYFSFRTGSAYAGAFFRSGIQSLAIVPLYFTSAETELLIGPSTYGIIGCAGIAVFVLLESLRMMRMQRSGKLFYTQKPKESKTVKKQG